MIPFVPDFTNAYTLTPSIKTTITSDTTTDGTAVDVQDYEGQVHLVITVADAGDASTAFVVSLIECATSGGTYTAVTGATRSFTASATANDNVGYFISAKNVQQKFVKARVVTSGGGTPSVPIHVSVLGRKKIAGSSGVLVTS